ncbi:hypothetical protein P4521_06950, partial [Geobacillus stearothermophilus]|nr:hypothetical protein [Geobacillus stearothermophilus]
HANFPPWFGLVTFTIQENSHFLYPLCTPTLNDQVQLVVKSLVLYFFAIGRQENFPIEPNDMLAEDKKYFKFF